MNIQHIAGYQFLRLDELVSLRDYFQILCEKLALKGTILLSSEGININLAGTIENIAAFKADYNSCCLALAINFHHTSASDWPFNKLKVLIKPEIITFKQKDLCVPDNTAAYIAPEALKAWLDANKDFILLDTRNHYETTLGTFDNAHQLPLDDFSQLPGAINSANLPKDKPIVTFCTGGIRCEKAALYLVEQGYKEVYQLQGGILGYFKTIGSDHFHGDCFVFDKRITLGPSLEK